MLKVMLRKLSWHFLAVLLLFSILGCELLEDRDSKIIDICTKFTDYGELEEFDALKLEEVLEEVLDSDFIFTVEGSTTTLNKDEYIEFILELAELLSEIPPPENPSTSTSRFDIKHSNLETATVEYYVDRVGYTDEYPSIIYLRNKNSILLPSNWKIYEYNGKW